VVAAPLNKLLSALHADAYQRLKPKLVRVTLHVKQILYRPNQAIHEVYFPENAVICLMTVMSNGDTLETGTVGLEGASWISASIGAPSMPCETIVAIGGDALVPLDEVGRVLHVHEPARRLELAAVHSGAPDPTRAGHGVDAYYTRRHAPPTGDDRGGAGATTGVAWPA